MQAPPPLKKIQLQMDCPLAFLDVCFQVANSCQAHFGVILGESELDYQASIDAFVKDVRPLLNAPFLLNDWYLTPFEGLQAL